MDLEQQGFRSWLMNNSLATNIWSLVLTISLCLLSLFPLCWVTYIAKLEKKIAFCKSMPQIFFSKKQPQSDPTCRALGFMLVSNIYDICHTYASSRITYMLFCCWETYFKTQCCLFPYVGAILNVLCQSVETKSWGFAMYCIVDEHSEDIKTFTTANIELLGIKC